MTRREEIMARCRLDRARARAVSRCRKLLARIDRAAVAEDAHTKRGAVGQHRLPHCALRDALMSLDLVTELERRRNG